MRTNIEFNELLFVFLRKNANFHSNENLERESRSHFEFQRKLILEKKIIFSGPLDGAGGLYFFDNNLLKNGEVEKLLNEDPLIRIGMFIPEIHNFFDELTK